MSKKSNQTKKFGTGRGKMTPEMKQAMEEVLREMFMGHDHDAVGHIHG